MYNLKRKKRSCKSYKGSEDKLIIITSNQNKEELDHSAFLKTKKQISTLSKKKKKILYHLNYFIIALMEINHLKII